MTLGDIFPLSVSPFEEYLLRDDRPGYPMTMPLVLMFRGKVDIGILKEAFHNTIVREPLFCAVVQRNKNRHYWVPAPALPQFVTEPNSIIEEGVERIIPLDVAKNPGVHCCYTPLHDGFALRLQVHHAVCDGLGSILFMGNWMAEYARLIGDDPLMAANPVVPIRIQARTNFHADLPHTPARWKIVRSFIRELSHWFGRPLYRLSPMDDPNTDSPHGRFGNTDVNPVLLWKTITGADLARIRQKSQSLGVSLNSYLTGQYYLYLCNRLGANKISDRQWIRLLIPTNLRKPVHFDIPASNMIGYAFLDRRISECIDSETFYQNIDHTINIIKKWEMGTMFISVIEILRRIPFALPMILSSQNCLSTSVFSNIGNPCKILPYRRFQESGTIEAGEAKLYRIIGAPPIRPGTPICCGLIRQNDELTLSMIVDAAKFGLESCRKFHGNFIDHVLRAGV